MSEMLNSDSTKSQSAHKLQTNMTQFSATPRKTKLLEYILSHWQMFHNEHCEVDCGLDVSKKLNLINFLCKRNNLSPKNPWITEFPAQVLASSIHVKQKLL